MKSRVATMQSQATKQVRSIADPTASGWSIQSVGHRNPVWNTFSLNRKVQMKRWGLAWRIYDVMNDVLRELQG